MEGNLTYSSGPGAGNSVNAVLEILEVDPASAPLVIKGMLSTQIPSGVKTYFFDKGVIKKNKIYIQWTNSGGGMVFYVSEKKRMELFGEFEGATSTGRLILFKTE